MWQICSQFKAYKIRAGTKITLYYNNSLTLERKGERGENITFYNPNLRDKELRKSNLQYVQKLCGSPHF